MSNIKNSGLD